MPTAYSLGSPPDRQTTHAHTHTHTRTHTHTHTHARARAPPTAAPQVLTIIDKGADGSVTQRPLMNVGYVPLTRPGEMQDGYAAP